MGKLLIFIVILLLIVGGLSMTKFTIGNDNATTTETVSNTGGVAPGLPISSSKENPSSTTQTEEDKIEPAFSLRSQLGNEILVARPLQGQKISRSPLITSGSAPSEWFKDGQFTVLLIGADGELLAEVPAYAIGEVTPNALVRFKATVPYTRQSDNPRATLILRADGKANMSKETEVSIVVNIL